MYLQRRAALHERGANMNNIEKDRDIPKTVKVAEAQSKHLDSIDAGIMKILVEKKEASYQDLANELNIKSKTTIGRRVKKLQNEGLVYVYKKDKNVNFVKWIGGVPAIESELIRATNNHVRASLLAEYYDQMVTNAYSLFSLLFEDNYWEIIMNLKEGLDDVELSQRIGDATNLDSIRRILVTCNHHNLIVIKTIRDPSGNDPITIFEPLYRIEKLNREYLEYFVIIRGLASAMIAKMDNKMPIGYDHLYGGILKLIVPMFLTLKNKTASNFNVSDSKILEKMLSNYDFAPDLDRIYKQENWRMLLKGSNSVKIDEKTDNLMIRESLSEKYKNAMIERVTKI
jgi:DNA-binding Lrp family transcriptional regulator